MAKKGHIVLIHGLWMVPSSWEQWVERFTKMGYEVHTPTWTVLKGKTVEEVRKDPSMLRGFGVREMLGSFRDYIKGMNENPILMGHSFGGLMVQLLLNEGFGRSGVAIHPAQTKGVLRLPFEVIKSAWPALKNPFDLDGLYDMSFEKFCETFANGVPQNEVREAYDRYYIPAPKRALIQVGLSNFTPNAVNTVDYKNPKRPPLLFTGGDIDHLVPASVVKENYGHYHTASKTDLIMYKGRSHFTLSQGGWEKVADDCLKWAETNSIIGDREIFQESL